MSAAIVILIAATFLLLCSYKLWAAREESAYHLRGWNRTVQMYKDMEREKREFQNSNAEIMVDAARSRTEIRRLKQTVTELRKQLSIATKPGRSTPIKLP